MNLFRGIDVSDTQLNDAILSVLLKSQHRKSQEKSQIQFFNIKKTKFYNNEGEKDLFLSNEICLVKI